MSEGNGTSMELRMDTSNLRMRIAVAPEKLDALLNALLDRYAVEAQDDARNGAPWTDRTGNARNGLNAHSFSEGGQRGIVLSHAVEYGVFLETMQGGKYRVIMPTLEALLPKVLKGAGTLLSRL